MKSEFKLPQLLIRKLVVIGTRKNYEVQFNAGLNIILGDSDTGKSSILNLINYALGAKSIDLYPEIQQAGKVCLLEVKISGKIYTIKRDIFDSKKDIEVFHSPLEDIEGVFPVKYYATFTPQGELEYFSDFLLNALGIPKLQLKESPSKAESKMIRLSFRDVFKYCYLTQDEVGSKTLLSSNNSEFTVRSKNQEVFKYLFNVLDANIAELNKALSEASRKQEELAKKHKTISAFLRDTQIESDSALEGTLVNIDRKIFVTQFEIDELHSSMLSDSTKHDDLRKSITKEDAIFQKTLGQIDFNTISIRNNVSLKKDYQQDIGKIKASIEAIEKIHGNSKHEFSCPLCSSSVSVNNLKEHFEQHQNVALISELKSLVKRVKEIDALTDELKDGNSYLQELLESKKETLNELRTQLDQESTELVSPFLAQIESLIMEKATLIESKRSIERLSKIRRSLSDIDSQIIDLDKQVVILQDKLALTKDEAPSIQLVIEKLANYLLDFLKATKVKALYGLAINNRSFLPILRNQQYHEVTSGGVRTLASIGYVLSLLQYSFSNDSNHPKLVMVDTVGKYLGKTSIKHKDTNVESDIAEGISVSDKTKYVEMYKYFIHLHQSNNNHQLIIVDNDLPETLQEDLQEYVVAHFDNSRLDDGTNGTQGFIDDAIS